jgi:hypothetical protein
LQISPQPLASALATEEPSIQSAWQAFIAHLPTMVVLWLVVIALSGIGLALSEISTQIAGGVFGVNGSDGDGALLAEVVGQLAQMPFVMVSSLAYVLFFSIPAQYYDRGEVITLGQAFSQLLQDPFRYLLAGVVFNLAVLIGVLFCIIPGVLISFVMPVYVNRIFLTNQPLLDALRVSFQTIYSTADGRSFVGTQVLAGLVVFLAAICTCGLGAFVAFPVSSFYIQNAAYHKGLIR